MNEMDENEFEFEGKTYVAEHCSADDCGFTDGKQCSFISLDCSRFNCFPECRADGRNVIFVEKQP